MILRGREALPRSIKTIRSGAGDDGAAVSTSADDAKTSAAGAARL